MKMHPDWEEQGRFGEYGKGGFAGRKVREFRVYRNRKEGLVGITLTSPPHDPTRDNFVLTVRDDQFDRIWSLVAAGRVER